MPTWFRSDDQRADPSLWHVALVFADSRAHVTAALAELTHHGETIRDEGFGPVEVRAEDRVFGRYVGGRRIKPFWSWQPAQLEWRLQQVTGVRCETRVGTLGRWDSFNLDVYTTNRAIEAQAARPIAQAEHAVGQGVTAAGNAVEGAGNLALSTSRGIAATGDIFGSLGSVGGLLLVAGIGFVAFKVLTR